MTELHDKRAIIDLAQLGQFAKLLWSETTPEGLMRGFIGYLHDHLRVKQYALVPLPNRAKANENELLRPDFSSFNSMPDEFRNEILRKIMILSRSDDRTELLDGFVEFDIGGTKANAAILGDLTSSSYGLAWIPETGNDRGVNAKITNELEFLVRQVQGQFIWFNRLNRTSAMLFRDDLTGLFNCRYLDLAVDTEIRRSARFQTTFGLLFIDLDNFKNVNDRFGHLAGSDVLKQMSSVLLGSVRDIDVGIRYGGDEYVVLLLGANATSGLIAANRIRARVEKNEFRILDSATTVHLTASIGLAIYPDHGATKDDLLKSADTSMYRSKHGGKNKVNLAIKSDSSHPLPPPAEEGRR